MIHLQTSGYMPKTSDVQHVNPSVAGRYALPASSQNRDNSGYYPTSTSTAQMHPVSSGISISADTAYSHGVPNTAHSHGGPASHLQYRHTITTNQNTSQKVDHTVLQSRPIIIQSRDYSHDAMYRNRDYSDTFGIQARNSPRLSQINNRPRLSQTNNRPALTNFTIGEGQRYVVDEKHGYVPQYPLSQKK